jgi:hypothetical protein
LRSITHSNALCSIWHFIFMFCAGLAKGPHEIHLCFLFLLLYFFISFLIWWILSTLSNQPLYFTGYMYAYSYKARPRTGTEQGMSVSWINVAKSSDIGLGRRLYWLSLYNETARHRINAVQGFFFFFWAFKACMYIHVRNQWPSAIKTCLFFYFLFSLCPLLWVFFV